jgi:N-acetylglucosaminyldiphosphoundecaprenol N-acetyl-beta-D-mannosaminyltransferase
MIEKGEQRYRVMNLMINHISYKASVDKLIEYAAAKKSGYCCFVNAHMTVEAEDKTFASQVNQSLLSVSDGMSLVFALKILYGLTQDRIAGMDVIESVLQRANDERMHIFILGGSPAVHSLLEQKLKTNYPGVLIAGTIVPPMAPIESYDNEAYIDAINNSGAQIVFVCLGCPKQEKWMAMFSPKINALLLGLGGALAVFAGHVPRSPGWMQRSGLEWLYRLIKEPKRLWKRYLVTNSLFIKNLVIQKLSKSSA